MDILLDIVHSVDYGVLAYISEHWRGGLSDTVWKVFSLMGSYGAVWILLFLGQTAIIAICVSRLCQQSTAIEK